MPDVQTRFFELADHHGRDHANNLEPIREIGLSIPVPVRTRDGITMAGNSIVKIKPADQLGEELARVIPDTRFIETCSDIVIDALVGHGLGSEVKEPSKAAVAKAVNETKAHKAAMAARDQQVKAGDEPAPDATDQPTETATTEGSPT